MNGITRRQFMAGSVAAVGAFAISSAGHRVLGAGDDIRVAIVGFNGKGGSHIKACSGMKGVRITALCDCDKDVLDKGVHELKKKGVAVTPYIDYRKLLEDKNVDAVFTATPNHWHSLITVWGCQAGKDVYVEKPVSHEIWEGRQSVEAARKYNRIVQAGTQSRSNTGVKAAFEYLKAGNLGKILCVRGFCYKPRGSIGKVSGPQQPPASVDYNLWLGPAPQKPVMRKQFHYDWHWFWDYGNADIGNQGIHEMDMCRWVLGHDKLPPRVIGLGGRWGYDDDAETPNTEVAFYDYQPAPLIFEVRGLPTKSGSTAMDAYRNIVRIGLVVDCEGGYYAGGSSGGWMYDKEGKKIKQFPAEGGEQHQENFIHAVRSRKKEDLHAEIAEGHPSSALCHMGNISYRLGKDKKPGEVEEIIKGNKVLAESFERLKQHVAANGDDVSRRPAILGPMLEFDPAKERFTGAMADEANKLVRREYRKPFEIPDAV